MFQRFYPRHLLYLLLVNGRQLQKPYRYEMARYIQIHSPERHAAGFQGLSYHLRRRGRVTFGGELGLHQMRDDGAASLYEMASGDFYKTPPYFDSEEILGPELEQVLQVVYNSR
jgi:hypothetical protein